MIKYLGSKRLLLPHLEAAFAALPGAERVLDLFSGTARVGRALKAAGHEVIANDAMSYAATLARCYVEADPRCLPDVERALAELAAVPPRAGYFTRTFCEEARFFHPKAFDDAAQHPLAADAPCALRGARVTSSSPRTVRAASC